MFCFTGCVSQSNIKFPKVGNNVVYSKIAALPFTPSDENISYGEDPFQYTLLWRAEKNKNKSHTPLVILIHGGCWLSEYDIQHTYALSTGLAQAGFNVWSLEYRRSGELGGAWPSTYDDVKLGSMLQLVTIVANLIWRDQY